MTRERKRYPKDHWLRSDDVDKALAAYLEQQSKAYSHVKNSFIAELVGDLSGKRVLDYGCGAGMFLVYAAHQGAAKVVGVDAEESVLATARHFTRLEGVERTCDLIAGDRLPNFGPKAMFDVVVMKDVIEHVPDDEGLLRDAAAVTAPGGIIVLSTQSSLSLNYLLEGTYEKKVSGNTFWCGWDSTHLRFYTPMNLRKKLGEAGFSVDAYRSVYIIPHKLPALPFSKKQFTRIEALAWVDKILGGIFPFNRLGWNIILRGRVSSAVPKKVPAMTALRPAVPNAPLFVSRQSNPFKE
jgi:2-polyprenyl-6-hydroxyphenyl methylase / 3-demethylubiquinone-9 3-methyltransferase